MDQRCLESPFTLDRCVLRDMVETTHNPGAWAYPGELLEIRSSPCLAELLLRASG